MSRTKAKFTATKRDVVNHLSAQAGLPPELMRVVFEEFLDQIIEALTEEGRIEFRAFGVFTVTRYGSREIFNPKLLRRIKVGPSARIVFKAGSRLMMRLNEKEHRA